MGKTVDQFTDGIKRFLFVMPGFPIAPGIFAPMRQISGVQKPSKFEGYR